MTERFAGNQLDMPNIPSKVQVVSFGVVSQESITDMYAKDRLFNSI